MQYLQCLKCKKFDTCQYAAENGGNCPQYEKKEEFMKHQVYFSSSIERELNPEYIGGFDTLKEMWELVTPLLAHKERYSRYLLAEDATYIDYGSYSRFLRAVPPLTREELETRGTD